MAPLPNEPGQLEGPILLSFSIASPPPTPLLQALTDLLNKAFSWHPRHGDLWPPTRVRITNPNQFLIGGPALDTTDNWFRYVFIYQIPSEATRDEDILMVRDIYEQEKAIYLKCLVGTGTLTTPKEDTELYKRQYDLGLFGVDKNIHGKGIGARMIRDMEDFVKREEEKRMEEREETRKRKATIELEALLDVGNHEYYLRHGYKMIHQKAATAGHWDTQKPFTIAWMEKVIVKGED